MISWPNCSSKNPKIMEFVSSDINNSRTLQEITKKKPKIRNGFLKFSFKVPENYMLKKVCKYFWKLGKDMTTFGVQMM